MMNKKVEAYVNKEKDRLESEFQIIDQFIQLRKEKNLSQRDFCKLIDMKQPQLAYIETKHGSLQLNTLLKILDALDCELIIRKKH